MSFGTVPQCKNVFTPLLTPTYREENNVYLKLVQFVLPKMDLSQYSAISGNLQLRALYHDLRLLIVLDSAE